MSAPFGYDGGDGGQQGNNEGHPAWQEYLNELPQELHGQVTPIFEKWDKGVQERFQKVHSQYEPWKNVINSGTDPNMAQFGINLLSQLETNPKYVYDALGQYYDFNKAQGEQGQENQQDQDNTEPWRGEIDQLRKQNQILASHALQRQEAERQQAADKALDAEFNGLKEKYGDYDELWVLSRMQGGASAEDAVKQYHEWLNKTVEGHKPRPLIMGAGGGVLGQNSDVTKMSDQQRRSAAVQMLQAMNAQRQQ
jgi:hypothetical protein